MLADPVVREATRVRWEASVEPEPNTGCWLWTGAMHSRGYGVLNVGEFRGVRAHRIGFALYRHAPDPSLDLDHLCRVRLCVNPDHMEEVAQRENILRGASPSAVHARKTHCPAGHPLSGDNLRRSTLGQRLCRACHNARELLANRRRREMVRAAKTRTANGQGAA